MGSAARIDCGPRTAPRPTAGGFLRRDTFPDCRVAVSIAMPCRSLVIERHKHPFLHGHAPKQQICLRKGYPWPTRFSAESAIRLLEDSIHALLYSYDARRPYGYHTLHPTRYYFKTIEFDDYRI